MTAMKTLTAMGMTTSKRFFVVSVKQTPSIFFVSCDKFFDEKKRQTL